MGIFSRGKAAPSGGKVTKVIGPESTDDVSKNIVCGEIVLQPIEYTNFWYTISKDRATCSRYLARIVILLINFEKDPIKTEKTLLKKYGTIESFIAVLLNTIQFIDMFVGFDPNDDAFTSAMAKYEQEKKTTPMFRNKSIDDGLKFLARRRGQRELAAVKMLVDCSTLESEEEIRRTGTSMSAPSAPSADIGYVNASIEASLIDFPFTFTALTRMSRTDVSQTIFDQVLQLLEGAGSALSSMAAMQGRTLALMFMLREFLTISPTSDQVWLHRACEVLIGLYKWPKPYGIIAKDVLDFVSLERRSPGCHLRDRILSENPELQPSVLRHLHPTDPSLVDAVEISPDFLTKRCSMVFLFLDQSQPLCCTNKYLLLAEDRPRSDTMDSNATPKHLSTSTAALNSQERLVSLRRDVLLHILDLDFHLREKPQTVRGQPVPEDPLGLNSKDERDVLQWYCRALAIVEKAKSLPATAIAKRGSHAQEHEENLLTCNIPGGLAKMYRESMLGALLSEISPTKRFSPRRSRESNSHSKKLQNRPSSLGFPLPLAELQALAKHQEQVVHSLSVEEGKEDDDDDQTDQNQAQSHPPPYELKEPMTFGQYAPSVPDMSFQVFDVGGVSGGFGEDFVVADRLDTMTIASSYSALRNEFGYVHFVQDTNDLLKMISDAIREQKVLHQPRELATPKGNLQNDHPLAVENKYVVRAILMGSNNVIHRFLCAYVVLLSQHPDIVKGIELEIYLTPVGKNKLGTFLARSDKWYRRHIYDSFKGPLGICPQYPSDSECSEDTMSEVGMQRTLPVSSLRKLLQDYVRQAKISYPVCVFETLCWAASEERLSMDMSSAPDDIFTQQSPPDIVIPFVMQIEIGFRTQVEQYRVAPLPTSPRQPSKISSDNSLSSTKDILLDKDFQISPIELSVAYVPSSMSASDSRDAARGELSKVDNFATLSFNNFPMTSSSRDDDAAETNLLPNAPHLNFLVMNSQSCKGQLNDAWQARKRNVRTTDSFLDTLANPDTYDPPQPISAVKVDVVNPRDRFHVLVDGCVYGPFRRIVIRSCQVGTETSDQTILSIPVMTYMPIATI